MTRPRRPREPEPPRLFEPGELALRPTGMARLRAAARRAQRFSPTERERREDEDQKTMQQLRRMADDLVGRFKLTYRAIVAERDGIVEHYGICYEDGEIRIRLRHAKTGQLLKESSLVDTLCHELAHLRYLDHSERFKRLYWRILDKARSLGYYRPGPGVERPKQLSLFDGGCGTGKHARTI